MAKSYSINTFKVFLLSLLLLTFNHTIFCQTPTEIAEQYRLKIIGETNNIYVDEDTVDTHEPLTKIKLISHAKSVYDQNDKTITFITALVNSTPYKGINVPSVSNVNELKPFCKYVESSISDDTKIERQDKYIIFQRKWKELIEEGKNKVEELNTTPLEAVPPPDSSPKWTDFTRPKKKEVQRALKTLGFYEGLIDGKMGPSGKTAVKEYLIGIDAKGVDILTNNQIDALLEEAAERNARLTIVQPTKEKIQQVGEAQPEEEEVQQKEEEEVQQPKEIQQQEGQQPEEGDISLIWKILILLNLLLFLILIILFILRRKNQKNETDEINRKILDSERKFSNKLRSNTDTQQGKIISTLQTRITNAERDLMLLKTKIDRQQITKTPSTPSMPTRVEKPVYTPPPIIKKYTEFPDTPNGFQVVSLSDTETANSRYEITLQNDTSATFIFKASQNATEYAINNSQMILRNACDYNNMPNEGKKIKTETPGRLTKEGGIWRILSKAKIRFYN